VTSQVSHPYKSTDFTQALNILILVSFRNDFDTHTLLSLENDPLAFCILTLTSLLVPPFSAMILQGTGRDMKKGTESNFTAPENKYCARKLT